MVKRILIICILFLGIQHVVKAQLQFGVKAGVNYNSNSFKDVSNDVLNGAKTKTGYHAGFWFSAKLPSIGLYIRPELVYTELNNDVNYNTFETLLATDYKFRKIDVPILFGKKNIFSIGNIFAGPSFQYIISSGFGINDLTNISMDQFSLGIQLGGGIEFGKLGIDVRWERGLSKIETFFVDSLINRDVNFGTKINQIIFGLSYGL